MTPTAPDDLPGLAARESQPADNDWSDPEEGLPPVDYELRRLAIKAGLIEATPADIFHDMAGALGFKPVQDAAFARAAELERTV